MSQFNFDATNIPQDAGGFGEPLPLSWYQMVIDESEMKDTSKGGAMLALRFSVMQGQYANRKAFNNYNVRNSNPQTEEIAKKQLSTICHAIGQLTLSDSAQLHNRPMWVKLGIEAGDAKPEGGKYPDRNRIVTIKPIDFAPPASEGINGEGGPAYTGGGAAAPAPSAAAANAGNPFATVAAPAPVAAAAPVAATPVAAPVPAAPVAPPVPAAPVAPAAPAFPPEGWLAHPTSPGWFYKGQEVLTEADLRARMAPAVPAAPAIPAAPALPVAPAPVAAAPVAAAPAAANPAAAAQTLTPPWAAGQ